MGRYPNERQNLRSGLNEIAQKLIIEDVDFSSTESITRFHGLLTVCRQDLHNINIKIKNLEKGGDGGDEKKVEVVGLKEGEPKPNVEERAESLLEQIESSLSVKFSKEPLNRIKDFLQQNLLKKLGGINTGDKEGKDGLLKTGKELSGSFDKLSKIDSGIFSRNDNQQKARVSAEAFYDLFNAVKVLLGEKETKSVESEWDLYQKEYHIDLSKEAILESTDSSFLVEVEKIREELEERIGTLKNEIQEKNRKTPAVEASLNNTSFISKLNKLILRVKNLITDYSTGEKKRDNRLSILKAFLEVATDIEDVRKEFKEGLGSGSQEPFKPKPSEEEAKRDIGLPSLIKYYSNKLDRIEYKYKQGISNFLFELERSKEKLDEEGVYAKKKELFRKFEFFFTLGKIEKVKKKIEDIQKIITARGNTLDNLFVEGFDHKDFSSRFEELKISVFDLNKRLRSLIPENTELETTEEGRQKIDLAFMEVVKIRQELESKYEDFSTYWEHIKPKLDSALLEKVNRMTELIAGDRRMFLAILKELETSISNLPSQDMEKYMPRLQATKKFVERLVKDKIGGRLEEVYIIPVVNLINDIERAGLAVNNEDEIRGKLEDLLRRYSSQPISEGEDLSGGSHGGEIEERPRLKLRKRNEPENSDSRETKDVAEQPISQIDNPQDGVVVPENIENDGLLATALFENEPEQESSVPKRSKALRFLSFLGLDRFADDIDSNLFLKHVQNMPAFGEFKKSEELLLRTLKQIDQIKERIANFRSEIPSVLRKKKNVESAYQKISAIVNSMDDDTRHLIGDVTESFDQDSSNGDESVELLRGIYGKLSKELETALMRKNQLVASVNMQGENLKQVVEDYCKSVSGYEKLDELEDRFNHYKSVLSEQKKERATYQSAISKLENMLSLLYSHDPHSPKINALSERLDTLRETLGIMARQHAEDVESYGSLLKEIQKKIAKIKNRVEALRSVAVDLHVDFPRRSPQSDSENIPSFDQLIEDLQRESSAGKSSNRRENAERGNEQNEEGGGSQEEPGRRSREDKRPKNPTGSASATKPKPPVKSIGGGSRFSGPTTGGTPRPRKRSWFSRFVSAFFRGGKSQ